MPDMVIIIPSRGRPHSVERIAKAWIDTYAYDDGAEPLFAIDGDDPLYEQYVSQLHEYEIKFVVASAWLSMVKKLNVVAGQVVENPRIPAVGFAGDDHLPRTDHWAREYLNALGGAPGVVSCPDGFRSDTLPTQWAMTSNVVRAVGRMVPAEVDHLYCDNVIRDLASLAECYHWLPEVLIEHMHPLAGKGETDAGYIAVNSQERYAKDYQAYARWRHAKLRGQATILRDLREARR